MTLDTETVTLVLTAFQLAGIFYVIVELIRMIISR